MQASDNDLDKMSKEAAEHFEPSGALPDWENMQLLLNKHLPVKKEPRRRIFIVLFLLLLVLGGGYFYYSYTGEDDTILAKKTVGPIKDRTSAAIPHNAPIVSTPLKEDKRQPGNNDVVVAQQSENDNTLIRKSSIKRKSSGKSNLTISQAGVTENQISVNDDDPTAETERATTSAGETGKDKQKNVPGTTIDSANSLTATQIPQQTAIAQNASADSNKIPGKKSQPVSTRKNRFEISLLYAPELTTIAWTNIDKPGSNYGLLVGYRLSQNLTIQTGFIKSRKNYTANEEDFKFTYSPTSSYKFLTVEGYCDMYEIPLNAKFTLASRRKYNVIGLAGLSSYFMTKEFYTYHYHNPMYDWSAQYTTQHNYWFSVATLAAGIEKDVSKNFNIGVIPFIKIPFTGMGKGELKLQGAGINFLLTYKPSFTKK